MSTDLVKGTLSRPAPNTLCPTGNIGPNYIKLISDMLAKNPGVKINPISPLYRLAVNQYNSMIKGTTTRPPIPSWFCGAVDQASGILTTSPGPTPQDQIDPQIQYKVLDIFSGILSVSPMAYGEDQCLQLGIPGTWQYTQCIEAFDSDNEGGDSTFFDAGIDWPTATIPEEILAEILGEEGTTEDGHSITVKGDNLIDNILEFAIASAFVGTPTGLLYGLADEKLGIDIDNLNPF